MESLSDHSHESYRAILSDDAVYFLVFRKPEISLVIVHSCPRHRSHKQAASTAHICPPCHKRKCKAKSNCGNFRKVLQYTLFDSSKKQCDSPTKFIFDLLLPASS